MNKVPEFSVIIPSYNRRSLLEQALKSVWAQTRDDYELIVVDDGSTDGTADYLASLKSRVKVVSQPNRGPAAARNVGVKQATGNYVAFMDSDDLWFSWTLATYHNLIQRYNNPSIICAAMVEFEGDLPYIGEESPVANFYSDYFETANTPINAGSGMLVIKRDVFNLMDGFDEKMNVAEDQDFFFRAGTVANFVSVLSPVTLAYRRHADNISIKLPLFIAGVEKLLSSESDGRYPGGRARQVARWKLLTRSVRPVALSCLKAGHERDGWRLYCKSFWMNARLGRLRFLLGFVLCGVPGLGRGIRKLIYQTGRPTLGRRI